MGSIEAFVAACLFLFRGIDHVSVQLAPLLFFLLFLAVNFYFIKHLFGLNVSVIANLILAIPPPALTMSSVTALGGYPETLFFGSLMLLMLTFWVEDKSKRWALFLAGLAAGIGYWVNNLILIYFLTLLLFVILKSSFWKEFHQSFHLSRFFTLNDRAIPLLLRFGGVIIHVIVCAYFIWQIISFFAGPREWSFFGMELTTSSPPFHVKKLKKICLLILSEVAVLSYLKYKYAINWQRMKSLICLAAGFLLGAFPVFLYAFLGGQGYRLIHDSGTIIAANLPNQINNILWHGFIGGVWVVPTQSLLQTIGWQTVRGSLVFILSLGLFVYFMKYVRRELGQLLRLRPFPYTYHMFPVLLICIVLSICLFSTLKSGRYLTPIYFATSLIFAIALVQIKVKSTMTAAVLFLLLILNNAYANFDFIHNLPTRENLQNGYRETLRFLKDESIQGGYANYWSSYMLTFESKESIIIAPYKSLDRYPSYTKFVNELNRVAYIFSKSDGSVDPFVNTLKQNGIRFESRSIEPFRIYVIDRTAQSELGKV